MRYLRRSKELLQEYRRYLHAPSAVPGRLRALETLHRHAVCAALDALSPELLTSIAMVFAGLVLD